MSDTLVAFLHARLDEDEARQKSGVDGWHHRGCESLPDVLYPDRETGACDCGVPERLLAEVEARKALLTEHVPQDDGSGLNEVCSVCAKRPDGDWYHYLVPAPCQTLRLLALPYAAHPGYKEAWRP